MRCMWRESSLINVREMEFMVVHWHSLPVNFRTKRNKLDLCYPQKRKKN